MNRCLPFSVAFFLTVYSCTSVKEKVSDIPIFDHTQIEFTDIKLSDIAQEVSYIQFDSTILFPGLGPGILLTEDFIFLKTNVGFFKYDRTGKFLAKIGAIGQGPGEYTQYSSLIHIEKVDDKLFILSDGRNILSYNLYGDFLNKMEMERIPETIIPSQICYYKNNYYSFYFIFPEYEEPYLWTIADTNGRIISSKQDSNFQPVANPKNELHSFTLQTISVMDESFLYWNEYNDTIFKITEDWIEPFWLWEKGDFRMTREKVQSKNWDFLVPMNVIDLNKQVLFAMKDYKSRPYRYLFFFYDKSTQTFTATDKPLADDLYGGMPLTHILNSFNLSGDEYLIGSTQPYDLIDALLETDTPKSRELAETIDDEGNPVMILIKLKK